MIGGIIIISYFGGNNNIFADCITAIDQFTRHFKVHAFMIQSFSRKEMNSSETEDVYFYCKVKMLTLLVYHNIPVMI